MRKVLVKYPVVGAPGFQVAVVQSDAEEGCHYCRKPTRRAISWGRSTPHGICLASSGKSVCPQCQEKAAGEMAGRVLAIVGLVQRVEVFQGGLSMCYHDPSLLDSEVPEPDTSEKVLEPEPVSSMPELSSDCGGPPPWGSWPSGC